MNNEDFLVTTSELFQIHIQELKTLEVLFVKRLKFRMLFIVFE